jgi:hypothetical protein
VSVKARWTLGAVVFVASWVVLPVPAFGFLVLGSSGAWFTYQVVRLALD